MSKYIFLIAWKCFAALHLSVDYPVRLISIARYYFMEKYFSACFSRKLEAERREVARRFNKKYVPFSGPSK